MFAYVVSGLFIGLIWTLFVSSPPQGYTQFPSSNTLPSARYLNTTPGTFIPLEKYLERKFEPVSGGETVFSSSNGNIYTGTIDGYLLLLNGKEGITKITHLSSGILGGIVTSDEKGIYLCVLTLGLVFVDLETAKIEIVSSISDDNIPIRFADDVTISNDGKVYFTDASTISPWIDQKGYHNAMIASSLDVFTGSGRGRVLVYDPVSRQTKTLLNGLRFANGITLSQDNDSLIFCETFGLRLTRLWLGGTRAGTVDYLAVSLPGLPDGISLASDGGYWVALNCKAEPQLVMAANNPFLSWVLARINPALLPTPKPFGGILKLNSQGIITNILLDNDGIMTQGLTSVKEYQNGLYLGSLLNSFVGFVDLSKINLTE